MYRRPQLTGLRDIPVALLVDSRFTPASTLHLYSGFSYHCRVPCAILILGPFNDYHEGIGPSSHLPRQSSVVMEPFRFRLNCIDHYQATPTDLDPVLRRNAGPSQRQGAPQVPVIRAFGATETGQKVCAHIHGALPYLYLEYTGSLEKDVGTRHLLVYRPQAHLRQ